ncbi:hypothetical protein SO802_021615 [Lithocarpus litseifolius]|uniref:Uncharacterized protein n=1 Tax=Lithocarpus litseifolius TaxID=425828 RepID=A0AAW2CIA6_9ROSI
MEARRGNGTINGASARFRVSPVALVLLELLRCDLPNHHRRLAHHMAAAGLAEEPRGLAEALALHESVLMIGFSLGYVWNEILCN